MPTIPADVWDFLSNEISDYFDVNPQVVAISIRKERIPERIEIPPSQERECKPKH